MISTIFAAIAGRAPRQAHFSIGKFLIYVLLTLGAVITMIPFFWMVTASLKIDAELFSVPLQILPTQLDWANYTDVWRIIDMGRLFLNTSIVTFADVVAQILLGAMAGYAFARLSFPGKNFMFVALLVTMMVPFEVLILPIFLFVRYAPLAGGNDLFGQGGTGMLNSYGGLIFPNLISVYGVFLFRQFFQSFPRELEDASFIDGCSRARFFFSILIPNSIPVIGTMGLFAFIWTWNDFLWPLVIVKQEALKTIQLGLTSGSIASEGQTLWAELMAGSTLAVLPVILLFLILQRFLVQGFVTTGLKG